MPLYEYASENTACPTCGNGMEVLQRLSDPALEHCASCGAPLKRIISAPHVVGGQSHRLSEDHVGKHGFTQYRRAGKGVYEKTAGKGPNFISGD